MAIAQSPSPLSVIVTNRTYNAQWFSGSTIEAQITAAITAAAADGALYVYIPANMLGYSPASVTFNTNIRIIREGQLADIFDPLAYGASVFAADNSLAFQQTINTASVFKGIVQIPAGTFLFSTKSVSNAFLTAQNNVSFRGAGIDNTILKAANGISGNDWDVFRTDVPVSNFDFSNFTYDGNGLNNLVSVAARTQGLFYFQYASRLKIEKIRCTNVAGQKCMTIGVLTSSKQASDVEIAACYFDTIADQVAGNVNQTDHSSIFLVATRANVHDNQFTNPTKSTVATAIENHSDTHSCHDNVINNYRLGVIAAALQSDQTAAVYSDNTMRNISGGYRTYSQNSQIFDILINGGSIEQSDELFPVIDLDYHTTLARRIVVKNIDLTNNKITPTGTGAYGVALGKVQHIQLQNITMKNLADRGVSKGDVGGWGVSETHLTMNDLSFIDCGRTTAGGTHNVGIGLIGGNKLVSVDIKNPTFVNTGAANSPMSNLVQITTNTDVFSCHGITCVVGSGVNRLVLSGTIDHYGRYNLRPAMISADRGDANATLVVGTDVWIQRFATNLTANRTVTLSSTNADDGDEWEIVRTGLGAFTLDVGGLKTIPNSTAARVVVRFYSGSWRLMGYELL